MCSVMYLKYRILTEDNFVDCYSNDVDIDAINDHCGGAATLILFVGFDKIRERQHSFPIILE